MAINISSWAIRNPAAVILLFILLTLSGLMAFRGLVIQNFPDVELPRVTVTASLPGAAPSLMESEVARPIERAIATVSGVKHIVTTLADGQASLRVEFRLDKPAQEAVDDVRAAIARIRAELPADLREPVARKREFSGAPFLTYTLRSSRWDEETLSRFMDDEVSRALLKVPGAGSVSRLGGASRELRVALRPERLLGLNTTASEISRQLRLGQLEAPGGRVDLGAIEYPVRAIATANSAAEIAAMDLTLRDGRRIRLDQVATVADTVAERRSAALLRGMPVVAFEVSRSPGHGEIDVATGVRAALDVLQKRYPHVQIEEAFNFVDPVVENYRGSMRLLYEGMVLAILVVVLFLRDWRATFIVALALPLSIIPTFAAMHLLGFSLNMVTLLALSLVVGVLVDDAIVEIENIERHLLMGKAPYQAAVDASTEIGMAVVATTFTLIAVFLPTAFMSGTVGRFFVQFGWTASTAVFFSLVAARMLTPMMAAHVLRKPDPGRAHREPVWVGRYVRWADWCLRHRSLTLLVAVTLVVGGALLGKSLPGSFIPPDDNAITQVTLTLPPGSKLADTVAAAERVRATVEANTHVKSVFTAAGTRVGGGSPSVQTAVLTLGLDERAARPGISKQHIERQLRDALEALPGLRASVGMKESRDAYEFSLAGDDGRLLGQHARQVERELRAVSGIGAIQVNSGLPRPELLVRPDFSRAADLGVSASAIADTLRVATVGDYAEDLAKLSLSARQVPVLVRLADTGREDLETLRRLPVPGARGPVPLASVASVEWGSGPLEITRRDQLRNVDFAVALQGRPLGEVEALVQALPSLRQLPAGIQPASLGDAEDMRELGTGFGMAMLAGVLCIYMVLVLLLKDFVQPVTLLVALVLSVPGAFLALFVTDSSLSLPAMIGLVMLMGIATKNSILLVDYIIIARRRHGLELGDAILDACRKRVRPIVMTTIAMGAGMVPVVSGMAGDPTFRAPMAIVVIGGLITSTLLSLFVIPVCYGCVDAVCEGARRRLQKARSPDGFQQSR